MTRFYLRVFLLMLLTLVLGIFTMLASIVGLERLYFRPNFADEMKQFADGIEWRLKDRSAEEARAKLEGLEDKLIFQIRVVGQGDPEPGTNSFYYHPKGSNYLLELRPDEALLRSFREKQLTRIVASLFLSGITIFLAALFVVLPLVRRLRLQEQTISAIAEGDLDARAPEGGDALGRLGARLNQMTRRIKELLAGQRQLINAVSHEMRTPTARLGFGLEMVANASSDEERENRIAAMHDDLGEMDGLLEELLGYLRFDQEDGEFACESLGLPELLDEIRGKVQPLAPGIAIEAEGLPAQCVVHANPHHFPRALENLVRNGANHASSRVVVRFASDGANTVVYVDDDGPGIPPADHQRVLEPFVRLDSSRDRKTGGTGLGLAISNRIVAKHHGTLTVDESPEGGARFVISLPRS